MLTHHDGVSGTEKQEVAFDYAMRLASGEQHSRSWLTTALGIFTKGPSAQDSPARYDDCPLLNVTTCPATSSAGTVAVTLFNPLLLGRAQAVRIPVASASVTVVDSAGSPVTSQVIPTVPAGPESAASSPFVVVFVAEVPAGGFNTYFVTSGPAAEAAPEAHRAHISVARAVRPGAGAAFIRNAVYKIGFSADTGRVNVLVNAASRLTYEATQDFSWYNSSAGNSAKSSQASGAYIFRPNGTAAILLPATGPTLLYTGPVVEEAHQFFGFVQQSIRLYANAGDVEVESTVGPIPIDDGLGKEIVSTIRLGNFTSGPAGTNRFWTDANGREMQPRVQNFRPTWTLNNTEPVASNFYPVTTALFTQAATGAARLTIVTDRSVAGTSLGQGELAVMPHRRTLYDDSRGVGEPLNETAFGGVGLVVRSTHRWILDTPDRSSELQRAGTQSLSYPFSIGFASVGAGGVPAWRAAHHPGPDSPVAGTLPLNVHLLSTIRERGSPGSVLLRLAHLFAAGEHPVWSKPATVDVAALFPAIALGAIVELNLSGNLEFEEARARKLRWRAGGDANEAAQDEHERAMERLRVADSFKDGSFVVTLAPQEIRTFEVQILSGGGFTGNGRRQASVKLID